MAIIAAARFRRLTQIQIDIVCDKEIKITVAVIIQKSAAGAVAGARDRQLSLFGNILKCPIAFIAVQHVMAVIGNEKIRLAVIIVVADAHALRPSFAAESGLGRDVSKMPVSLVVIKLRQIDAFGRPVKARAVRNKNVVLAIAVIIKNSDAIAGSLQNIVLPGQTAVNIFIRQAKSSRYVLKIRKGVESQCQEAKAKEK